MKAANYNYKLGRNAWLEAYSIDPKIGESDLEQMLLSRESYQSIDFQNTGVNLVGSLGNLEGLKFNLILDKQYQVPKQLQAYREAIEIDSNKKGRYNGPVAIIDGDVGIPLNCIQGGFYDFIATKLTAIPNELVPEYPPGKTVKQIFEESGLDPKERARYFAFAFLLNTDGNFVFVERAKGMAIAAGVMSFPGSTPNPKFDEPGFNIKSYLQKHLDEEINDEFCLDNSEFAINNLYLFDDLNEIPFTVAEIKTDVPMSEIASRLYGNEQAIKEHPIFYTFNKEGIKSLLQRFPIYRTTAKVLDTIRENSL